MKKNRKVSRRRRKARFIASTTLKIAPVAIAIALVGRWTWANVASDLKFDLGFDDVTRFLNSDKTIEEQADMEIPEETNEDLIVEEDTEADKLTANESMIPSINLPSIIEQEEFERTSSELYDMGATIPYVEWEGLNQINEDVEAWIQIPGTKVNTVIVQGGDNDYYLHHSYKNEADDNGTVFIDHRDNPLTSDMTDLSDVTTIYGHNLRSGKMFGTLSNYKSQAFYDRNPYGIITTETGEVYKLDFFAGIIVDGKSENNVYIPDFIDESEFKAYFDYIAENSLFTSDVNVEYGDKIVVLSTCSYEVEYDKDARFVLFARLTKQLENTQEATNSLGK